MQRRIQESGTRNFRKIWGLPENTNAALDLASGDYVALLDHDDFLEKHALFEIVRFLQNHRDADMLYTDEDKVTFDSKTYFHPHYNRISAWIF